MSDITLSPAEKTRLKNQADKEIEQLSTRLQAQIDTYRRLEQQQKDLVPQLQDLNLDLLDGDSANLDNILAKIRLFSEKAEQFRTLKQAPYFLKLKLTWRDSGKTEEIFIGKHAHTKENIYSWFAPIATLRYDGVGEASYQKPDDTKREARVHIKDDFLIQNAEIVFMTHETEEMDRQVVFQKHMAERREFLLPEIVAELDKLQDQIIRSDPHGPFLISGPAGSGKTTLALHRVAYLVLTPEFKDYFQPEKIMVYVADQGAVQYFSQLLPELGIHGVKISTFNDWATMIANSRFRAKLKQRFRFLPTEAAIEFLEEQNPYPDLPPSLSLAQIRKFKQQMIEPIRIKEGSYSNVFPSLKQQYEFATHGEPEAVRKAFDKFIDFQAQNKYLDEADLMILLNSLEKPIKPFAHVVVDEVQNWLPSQIEFISKITSRVYNATTFIGDIRQKTKAFSISSWSEIQQDFGEAGPRQVELLKVYRNTKQILQHLQDRGYQIQVANDARSGPQVERHSLSEENIDSDESSKQSLENLMKQIIEQHEQDYPETQLGILTKYKESLADIAHLANQKENIHIKSIFEAQGLEFHTVVLLYPDQLQTSPASYKSAGTPDSSAHEFSEQDKHLYYVAVTRAKERLVLVGK